MLVQVAPPQLFLETCDRQIVADHEEFHTSHFRKSDAQKKLPRITSDGQRATRRKGLIGWDTSWSKIQAFRRKIMSSNIAEIAAGATLTFRPGFEPPSSSG
jgi:hypothetical protein